MKPRHHLYFDAALSERLDELARKPGSSKSAIVADALRAWLDRAAEGEMEAVFRQRLDRLSRQMARLERDQQVLLESLALFIRYQFTVIAPLPESEQAAARALGHDRFQAFVEQVGRRFGSPKSLARDLIARVPAENGEAGA